MPIVSRPPVRHRVARVGGEVDQHLVHVRRIGQDLAPGPARQDHQSLVGAEQALEHRHQRHHRRVQVHQPRLVHLAAAEGEELLRHPRGPGRAADHLVHVGGLRVVGAELLEDEIAEAEHGHELVVHLVRHAAGERADRLELLGLAELLLRLHPVSDVGVRAHPLADGAVLVQHRYGAHLHVPVFAVVAAEPVLEQHRPPVPHRLAPRPRHLRLVLGVDGAEPATAGRLELGLPGERDPLAQVERAGAVGRRGPDDARGGHDERPVARLAPAEQLLGPALLGDVVVHLDHGVRPAGLIAVEDPVTRHLHDGAVARLARELRVPLAVLQQRRLGLALEHRELGGQELAGDGARRLLGRPAVQLGGSVAPEPDSAVEAAREHRRMGQDLEQLARLALAFARGGRGRGLRAEPLVAQRQLRLRAIAGAALGVGPAHDAGDPERRRHEHRDESRDEHHQSDVDLVEAETEGHQAAGREQQGQQHGQREQQPEKRRPGIPSAEQHQDGGFVRGDRHAARQEEEDPRGVQRGPEPVRETVQLGHADEMAHDRDHREDDHAEHDGGLHAARPLPGPARGQQEGEALQEQGRGGDGCRSAREDPGERGRLAGEEQPVDVEVDAEQVLGHDERGEQRRHQRQVPLDACAVQVRGQQAGAGEQDQHGGERLGRQDELRQREQAPDGEHVAPEHRDPERDRDDARRQGRLAEPRERPVADVAHRRRLSAFTSAQSSSSSTRWNASSPITPRARRSDSRRRSSAKARRCTLPKSRQPSASAGSRASSPCSARSSRA